MSNADRIVNKLTNRLLEIQVCKLLVNCQFFSRSLVVGFAWSRQCTVLVTVGCDSIWCFVCKWSSAIHVTVDVTIFLVARLCPVSRVLRFLPVSPAPCLSSGLSLSLILVSSYSRRTVIIGLCATRILIYALFTFWNFTVLVIITVYVRKAVLKMFFFFYSNSVILCMVSLSFRMLFVPNFA